MSVLTTRLRLGASVITAVAIATAGCSFDPGSIPVPGASVSRTSYSVRIEFANALNLPAQAKVVLNGAKVGVLRSVEIVDPTPTSPGRVDAWVDIADSVRLPTATTAQLQQSTILGDIFIGLSTGKADSGTTIQPGGTIPLDQTRPALQVEDLLAGMSTFVGSGALQQVQDIIHRTNTVLPDDPTETARIFETIGRDVTDLSANQDDLDRFLDSIETALTSIADNRAVTTRLLTEHGAQEVTADVQSLALTLGVVGSLGAVGDALTWLGPPLKSGDAAAKALVPLILGTRPLDLSVPSNLRRLVELIDTKVIPFVEQPRVNITEVHVGGPGAVAGTDHTESVIKALRMIGVVR